MTTPFHASCFMASCFHLRWQPVPRRRASRLRAQLRDACTAIALGAGSGVFLVIALSQGA